MNRQFNFFNLAKNLFYLAGLILFMCSCTSTRKLRMIGSAAEGMITDSALAGAHIGICIYEPASARFLYAYNADKYFVPASNTKLFSCYAAMKYLGDSLPGLRYENGLLQATGDPTFLHPDFPNQPVVVFLEQDTGRRWKLINDRFVSNPLGRGWSWEDYSDDYMVERAALPVYGNVYRFKWNDTMLKIYPSSLQLAPPASAPRLSFDRASMHYAFKRNILSNEIFSTFENGSRKSFTTEIPFKTSPTYNLKLLKDTIAGLKIEYDLTISAAGKLKNLVRSQPTDSVLKITMHRSDNFFAEQLLQMVSFEKLGVMSDQKIIDTLLKTDLSDLPQKPVWVDGSGLSRYNLFTPHDFVKLLGKMQDEFGIERMKAILPTGGKGTLSGLYTSLTGRIFAKTGTLSGQVALSGYLVSKSNKVLLISILVNNHNSSAARIRRAVERFVLQVADNSGRTKMN